MNSSDSNLFGHAGRRSCLRALVVALLPLFPVSPVFGQAAPAAPATEQTTPESSEEVVVLSPFQVTGNAIGYFQANTMSGTRLNSKIEDLGQSITVMTKEQMADFAMLDINDVFDYMAGTEGTNTYSDFVVDRTGAVTDNVSLDPNNANRVRGIGNANIAFNNIATTGRVPVDPLWMDSIELSRGPNANIFGLGNAAGTVNQVPATANLYRDFSRVEGRVDSQEGWRGALDVNRVLLKDKLALRASYAYQHTGFERQPSGEDMRRLSLQFKAQPFKNTTVSASWYNFKNASQRPNFTTPRDNITSWIAAGRPAWDPVTRLISVGGITYGQNTASGNQLVAGSVIPITNALPTYFNNSPSDGRSIFRIGNPAEAPYWTIPTVTNATTPAANGVSNNIRFVRTGAVNDYGIAQPLWNASYAALSDKTIYDWENINLAAANKAWDDVDTYLAELDQIFLNTPRQTLAAQFTYLREDANRIENLPLGPASVNGIIGEIYADPNTRNLDGSANPYFGRPYLRSKEPYLRERPLLWETSRAQAVYRFDFTQNEGWSKWLGSHQLLGYYEYKDQESRHFAWRHTTVNRDQPWILNEINRTVTGGVVPGTPLANRTTGGNNYQSSHNHMRVYEFYYVGDTPGGGVEYAPNRFPEGATVPFVWGNTGNFRSDSLKIAFTPSPDGSAGNASKETVIKTKGGILQSTFLNDRLVTTFGYREDQVYDRNGVNAVLTPDLLDIDYAASSQWQDSSTWRVAEGTTETVQFVLRPFKDLKFLENQKSNGGVGGFLAEAISGFSPYYNKSDSFVPQGPAVDLFLRPLPNQTGESKDIGFWLTLMNGRLSIRYNHYETIQKDKRDGDINTIAQRVLRADGILNSNNHDGHNLQDNATNWITQTNPTWTTAQVQAEVARQMGLTTEFMAAMEAAGDQGRIAATQDVEAKGDELEINFNPTRAWTVSASVTRGVSINKNAGSTIEEWIDSRMPIWTTIEDPRFTQSVPVANNLPVGATGHLLWRHIAGNAFRADFSPTGFGYSATVSAAGNFAVFVEGPVAVYRSLEGRPRPQYSKYSAKFSTKYNLSGISDSKILNGMSVGGSVRWDDKKAIGFYGVGYDPATFPSVRITALDADRPVFTPAETYIDLFVSYKTKMFDDKVVATFQINARNITESGGRLLPTQVFPDGTPLAYRIIDPRQFILSASFNF